MKDILHDLLTKELCPTYLHVEDNSHHHKGHTSAPEGGNSHFYVTIVSPYFEGKSRVKRHQTIYAPLKEKFEATSLHALQIKAYTPQEWETCNT